MLEEPDLIPMDDTDSEAEDDPRVEDPAWQNSPLQGTDPNSSIHHVFQVPDESTSEPLRTHYLPFLYKSEAPAHDTKIACAHCGITTPTTFYQCEDCFGTSPACGACCNSEHKHLPFHHISSWTPGPGSHLCVSSPEERGYVFHLGHGGEKCLNVAFSAEPKIVTIMDISGIHRLPIMYCNCSQALAQWQQLLDHQIYPATDQRPATGFTFRLLQHFHQFNLTSKSSAHDYHQAIKRLTDPVFPENIQSCYKRFVAANRQWRVLMMLKSAGKMDSTSLKDGELTTSCPACPVPGYNIPEGWKDSPEAAPFPERNKTMHIHSQSGARPTVSIPGTKGTCAGYAFREQGHAPRIILLLQEHTIFPESTLANIRDKPFAARELLYARFYQGDGNFHLQQKAGAPGPDTNPSLVGDAGYYAKQEEFEKFVAECGAQEDSEEKKVDCNNHAGNPARANTAAKMAVTGVYACSCRHVMFQAGGVVDFKKGEQYAYVDVAVAAVIRAAALIGILRIVFSYDIACKYGLNFFRRIATGQRILIQPLVLLLVMITWLVPKFHLGGHKPSCADKYSFNYTPLVGRMSGELVETPWASLNWLQYATREMGWGSRRDTLTDHFNHWNWCKLITMPKRIHKDFSKGVVETQRAKDRLSAIEETLGKPLVDKLREESNKRGGEQYRPDPTRISHPTQASALAELRSQELKQAEAVGAADTIGQPRASSASFVNRALDLEKQLQKYCGMIKTQQPDEEGLPGVQHELMATKLRLTQQVAEHYKALPELAPELINMHLTPAENLHKDPIPLPSTFTKEQREAFRLYDLAEAEIRLRVGQAHDALDYLRRALGVRSFLTRHARTEHGYALSTRAQQVIARSEEVVKRWGRVYRRAWAALSELEAPASSLQGLQELRDEHLMMLGAWLEDRRYANNPEGLPWIWKVSPLAPQAGEAGDADMAKIVEAWNEEVIRLEWVHAAAAYERWVEELHLLREESRRVAVSFQKEAERWTARHYDHTPSCGPQALVGYKAFTRKQSRMYQELASVARKCYAALPLEAHAVPE